MYQNLSMATQSLLGLGKLIMRLVLLKPTDNTDESERALVGNTILVAQPSPEMIAAELPPTDSEQATYFNVVYGAGASEHASTKLNKKKALTVNRRQYLECARIRAERCPLLQINISMWARPKNDCRSPVFLPELYVERWRWTHSNISSPNSAGPQRMELLSAPIGMKALQMTWRATLARQRVKKHRQIPRA